jgi:phospholipid transport system substrate-binding protein
MAKGWKSLQRWMPRLVWMLAVFIPMSLSPPALAAAPQARVREILAAVAAVFNDPQLQGAAQAAERKRRVRQIIFDALEFEEMARIALGPHWARLTPEQRAEFVRLFGDLFERSYNRLVLRFLPERDTVYGTESIEQERAMVQTTLLARKTFEQLPVDYRLIVKGQRWAVFDVVVDGVSLAHNYRAQFDSIIRNSSYETLLRRMKGKLEQDGS